MFKDIVKATIVSGLLCSVLGACSAGAGGANITPQAVQANATADRLHTEGVAVMTACTAAFSCSSVKIIKALSADANTLDDVLLYGATASTNWQVTSPGAYRFEAQTVDTGALCENGCSLVVSSAPLADGASTTPSVIVPKLAQPVRTMVTFPAQSLTFPAGAYYFYLATVPT